MNRRAGPPASAANVRPVPKGASKQVGYTPTVAEVNTVARDLSGLGLSDSDDDERFNLLRHNQPEPPPSPTTAANIKSAAVATVKPLRNTPLSLKRGPFGRTVDGITPALNPPVVLRMRCLVLGSAAVGKTSVIRKAIGLKEPNGHTVHSIPRCGAADVPRIKKKATYDRQSYLPTIGVRLGFEEQNAGTSTPTGMLNSSAMPPTGPVKGRHSVQVLKESQMDSGEKLNATSSYVVPVFVPEANVLVELHCLDLGGAQASLGSFDYYFKAYQFHLCNALLVVCDLMQPKSFGIQKWLEKVRLPQLSMHPIGCVVGNKLDQLYDAPTKQFSPSPPEAKSGAEAAGFGYFETSVFAEDDSILKPFHYLAENYARRYRNREDALRDLRT